MNKLYQNRRKYTMIKNRTKENEMNLVDADNIKIPSDVPYKGAVRRTIMQQSTAFDIGMVLEQLEDYGKWKGVLYCEEDGYENYIPVSVAKKIVQGRGLGGVLGYLEVK